MRLHPTHPGLHHLAADMLYRARRPEQAAIEYAIAVQASPRRTDIIEEILRRLPPAIVPRSLPTSFEQIDLILNPLLEHGELDIGVAWLERVLRARPGHSRSCEQLFTIAAGKKHMGAARAATARCADLAPSYEARIGVATLMLQNKMYSEVLAMLHDAETWPGLIDRKMDAWLLRCETYEVQNQYDEAKRCLRRLDGSGNVSNRRRGEILTALTRISDAMRAIDVHEQR
jgi:hypothetical protein